MKIIFLGHSLVEYFDWQARFPSHEVRNLGVAGETTGELLGRADSALAHCSGTDAVLVMTGTNDVLMGDGGFLDDYRRLAGNIARRCRGARIVLHSVLPVHPQWLEPRTIDGINAGIRNLAAEGGAEYFDLTGRFTRPDGEPDLEMLLEDGVHLSPAGYRVWSDALEHLLNL